MAIRQGFFDTFWRLIALANECDQDVCTSWTLLNDAILHIQTHGWPDLSPSQYDCSSWREVIHRAQLFDVDKRPSQGGVMTWYRTRLP
jgi:hypothetical protein